MQPKYIAMAAALAEVAAQLQKTADVYGKLDSQESNYRSLQQTVTQALGLPEDADTAVPPPPVVLAAMTPEQVEEVVGRVLAAIPPATDAAGIVTAIAAEIEQSDVAVMAAIAETRSDIITHIASTAAEPAAS